MKILKHWYAISSNKRFVKHLRKKGVKIGNNVLFKNTKKTDIDLSTPLLIEIGDNVFFNRDFTLLTHDAVARVFREKYNDFSANSIGRVKIGNNVSFARNVTVLKGVTIGDNVFVAHSSLVTKDIPPNCIAAGIPAKVICSLDDYYERYKKNRLQEIKEYCDVIRERTNREPRKKDFKLIFEYFVDGSRLEEYYDSLGGTHKKRAKVRMNGQYERYKKYHKSPYNSFEEMIDEINKTSKK